MSIHLKRAGSLVLIAALPGLLALSGLSARAEPAPPGPPALPAGLPGGAEPLLGEPTLQMPVSPGENGPSRLPPEAPPPPFRLRMAPAAAHETILPPLSFRSGETPAAALRMTVKEFRFKGNHHFSSRTLRKLISHDYENREIGPEGLEAIRQLISVKYAAAGFINSGALIEEQPLNTGRIVITVVEGRLSEIEVRGNRWFRSWWLRSEVRRFAGRPLNERRLKEGLQLLRQDPNILQINADLQPGAQPGEAVLELTVQERQPFRFSLECNNSRPPSVGAYGLTVHAADLNLTGHRDALALSWGLLRGDGRRFEFSGDDTLSGSYTFPVTPWGTTVELRAGRSDSRIVEEAFRALDIASETTEYAATLRQPLYQSLHWEVSTSLGFERRMNDSSLLERPFSLSPGAVNGTTEVDVLRAALEVTQRSTTQVVSFRSIFSWGLDAFDATLADPAHLGLSAGEGRPVPDGRFFSWVGQGQYVRRLSEKGLLAVVRVNAQLSDRPLLSLEQFPLGGVNSVRGYRENTLLRDNAVFASLELRIPCWQRGPEEDRRTLLALVPFFDFGTGWRNVGRNEVHAGNDQDTLESVGIGLLFDPHPNVHFQVFYGYAFNRDFVIKHDRDLQDYGIHFAFSITAF